MKRASVRVTCSVLAVGCLLGVAGCGWLTASFTVSPASGFPPLDVAFDGAQSTVGTGGPIVQYLWEFGDGGTAEGIASTHTYGTPGTHKVTLTVVDDAGWLDKKSKRVVVLQTPVARFAHVPGTEPLSIMLDGSASEPASAGFALWDLSGAEPQEIVEYEWDFGDGTTASGRGIRGYRLAALRCSGIQ